MTVREALLSIGVCQSVSLCVSVCAWLSVRFKAILVGPLETVLEHSKVQCSIYTIDRLLLVVYFVERQPFPAVHQYKGWARSDTTKILPSTHS